MSNLIAITGGTGFLGGHLVPRLRGAGHRLRLLVRDANRAPGGIDHVVGALDDRQALEGLCKGATALVHMAGAIAAPSRAAFFAANATGAATLAEVAARAGVGRVVHISSLAAREPSLSDYAASKRVGEDAFAAQSYGFRLAVLRPPAVYGPGDRATLPLIAQLTKRYAVIPGHREARFSLIFAADLARLIENLIATDWAGTAEVADGKTGGYSWHELAATAAAVERHPVTPLFLPRPLLATVARVYPLAGLTPGKVRELYHRDWVVRGPEPHLAERVTFAAGFRDTVAWYRAQGWLPAVPGLDRSREHAPGENHA